jgi:hypothetical protein
MKRAQTWTILSTGLALSISLPLFFYNLFGLKNLWDWHLAWHVFGYLEGGFIKRGVVGTIGSLAQGFLGIGARNLSLLMFSIALVCFSYLFWRLAQKSQISPKTRIAFLLSPGIFLHLGFDAPRTQELIWLSCLTIACLIIQDKNEDTKSWLLAGILGGIAVLTYEGSAFYWIPTLMTLAITSSWRSNTGEINTPLKLALSNAPLIIALAALSLWGQFEAGPETLQSQLQLVSPESPEVLSEVLTNNLVADNLNRQLGLNVNWLCNSPILGIYVIVWLIAIQRELSLWLSAARQVSILVLFAMPSFICIVALDYARYMAITITCSAISLMTIHNREPWSNSKIWSILAGFLVVGPIGVAAANPFPLMEQLFG